MINRVLGALGWVGTVLVFAGFATRFAVPEQQAVTWWLSIVGLVLVVLYTLGQWREILALFARRQARYGVLAISSVLIAVGILVAVNYVLARQNKRWDLTAAKQYSLSDQTRRVLEALDEPIKVLVFARAGTLQNYRDRLSEYEYTSSQISVEYVDLDRNPILADQYEVQTYGTIVFDYEGRVERVISETVVEQDVTNALIKAVEGEERTIYFVQGHGERDPNSADRDGYSALTEGMRLDNLSVETVVLAQTSMVPEDASVLVIAGPTTDLPEAEVELFRNYLEQGGKALLLLDPPTSPDDSDAFSLVTLAAEWGIEVGTDVVIDAGIMQLQFGFLSAVAASYPPHAITERFNLLTAFPSARSVRPASGGADGRFAETFVETGPQSWAESNLGAITSDEVLPELDEDEGDIAGPIPIAAAVSVTVENEGAEADGETTDTGMNKAQMADPNPAAGSDADDRQARLVVIGDSDFATNRLLGIPGNRDLVLNVLNWLAEQENLIAVRPRAPEDRRITLTADQQSRISWLVLLVIPGVVLGSGVYTWRRRRQQ